MIFHELLPQPDALRTAILSAYRMDESHCLQQLLPIAQMSTDSLARIDDTARELVTEIRKQRLHQGSLDAFLLEYNLASEEGIALMCLAEALLRVPDKNTMDDLIRDKITSANWESHVGKSEFLFVNAATWGLMLTGKILNPSEGTEANLKQALKKFFERSTTPVIRSSVKQAMKILGFQFVTGRTIVEALKRSLEHEKKGYRYSYDMLGEGAKTAEDAERYFQSYQDAIAAISKKAKDIKANTVFDAPGISVKLSALHPRYEFSQREWMLPQLTNRLRQLALQAKQANINFTVDAEEADRLDLSLDIIAEVFSDPALAGWEGFGLAVQAYQKRAMPVLDWLIDLARKNKRRIMVRLVKGAYWDYEIKDSQVKGLDGYPVFTRKYHTDVSYLACVQKMASAPDAIYSAFATHNAHTVAYILELMGARRDFEFQCLHGMGATLYDFIIAHPQYSAPIRIYAPVGTHQDLLAYLVRRLLENGANTSFINRIVDEKAPIKDLIADPIAKTLALECKPHPKIPLPSHLFGANRLNSRGLDLSNTLVLNKLMQEMEKISATSWQAAPLLATKSENSADIAAVNPANLTQTIGTTRDATRKEMEQALDSAEKAMASWDATQVEMRAQYLEKIADLLEQRTTEFMTYAIREAGKNVNDALGEVREAVDACRYYALEARRVLSSKIMPGPTGEFNQLLCHGRGITICISPWNFPLAIFTAQIVAALVAGNPVIAKPAEQTPITASKMVELMYQAGIPRDVLQLLPGKGEIIGAGLIADSRVKMVVFTGGTTTARLINQTLANREGAIIPLVAETGGQNVMLVDSTALPEQVVTDVVASAFNSAGQRCSALRVLFLQEEVADKIIHMLQGAMAEIQLGDPSFLRTDIGPVIDQDAKAMLEAHAKHLNQIGKLIYEVKVHPTLAKGVFFAPRAYEIPDLSLLKSEVFGPILHVVRYRRENLDQIIDSINHTGYGLTLGIHTRINETVDYIQSHVHVGNVYVNRNIIGAVIGVQPFGGEGLSGTGPKAGGPHYLTRFVTERTLTINTTAAGGNASLLSIGE